MMDTFIESLTNALVIPNGNVDYPLSVRISISLLIFAIVLISVWCILKEIEKEKRKGNMRYAAPETKRSFIFWLIVLSIASHSIIVNASDSNKPHVVTENGIKITQYHATSSKVTFTWTTDRTDIKDYTIMARPDGSTDAYEAIGTTEGTNYVHEGFTVGKTWRYYIKAELK